MKNVIKLSKPITIDVALDHERNPSCASVFTSYYPSVRLAQSRGMRKPSWRKARHSFLFRQAGRLPYNHEKGMKPKNIVMLGCTGSIDVSTQKVAADLP